MSHKHNQPEKQSIGGFKLSSNFNQLYTQKKQQTEQFIKDIIDKNPQKATSSQKSKEKSLKKNTSPMHSSHNSFFKLNTKSQALLDEVPVQMLKKKSQSRLQSMHDSLQDLSKKKFNLFQNQSERKDNILREKRQLLKKYNIDINAVMSQQNSIANVMTKTMESAIQQEDPQGTVKPSQVYNTKIKVASPFTAPTIFQTPLLPCFASQFNPNPQFCQSKTIKQGQGVWKIGKIKIKKNKGILKIGQIQYDCQLINGQGKCVGIKQDFMYKLKNWNGIWISQPKQQNF